MLAIGNSPVSAAVVTLLEVSPGTEAILGAATTDPSGQYSINYAGSGASVSGDPNKDVKVVVTDASGQSVGASPVVFRVGPEHKIDIVAAGAEDAYVGLTEYERVDNALAPHLGTLGVIDIDAGALEILAKRADVYPPHLGMFVQAARLANNRSTSEESFYALLRSGLPPGYAELVRQTAAGVTGALEAAYAKRWVSTPSDPQATTDAVIAELASERIDAMLLTSTGPDATVGDALATSALSAASLRTFVETWDAHVGTKAEFFANLAATSGLPTAEVATLEFTARSAALTDNFLPALSALQALRTGSTIAAVDDLASWDVPEWITFLTPVGAPAGLAGETDAERIALYAETMNRIIEAEYPAKVLARRLDRDRPPSTTGVASFLDANPGFDVRTGIVATYLDDNAITLDPTTESNLKQVQRIYAVTPPLHAYAVAKVLLDLEIGSAAEIVRMGPSSFAERYATNFDGVDPRYDGQKMAEQVYKSAVIRNGIAVALMTRYAAPTNAVHVDATQMPAVAWAGPVGATLESLFGNQDFCACEHCKSQFGPAAYFVALLAKLEGAPAIVLNTALEVLQGRRGDLTELELSCANSNTVMPYIDLVTELLEQVATGTSPPTAYQTSWSAEELRVHPEHVDTDAYEGSQSPEAAVFPWSLPFHLPTTETREYTKVLGASRLQLMETLVRDLTPPAGVDDAPEHADLVAEKFGMTRLELQIVTNSTAYETTLVGNTAVEDAWNVGDPAQIPTGVGPILATTGLAYAELMDLIALSYINSFTPPIELEYANELPSCDVADLSLLNFDASAADRLHRFLRLSRMVRLTHNELNMAIARLGGGTLDYTFVKQLAALVDVANRLRMGFAEAIALWQSIPTWSTDEEPSLYDRLFTDRRVNGVPNPAFVLSGGVPPAAVDELGVHREAIRGALRISDTDFDQLLAELGLLDAPAGVTTLANLSMLYRHTALASAMGVSTDAALRLWRLIDVDPFAGAPETLAYLDLVDEVLGAPMSVEEVDYICRGQFTEVSGVHPATATMDGVLATIDAGVVEIDERLAVAALAFDVASGHLEALVSDPNVVALILALVSFPNAISATQEFELEQLLTGVADTPAALASDITGETGTTPDDRIQARASVLNMALEPARRELEETAMLGQVLADFGGIAAQAALTFVTELLTLASDPLRVVLLDDTSTDRNDAVLLFHKVALVVRSLSIQTEDLAWYFEAPLGPQSMDLNALPLTPVEASGRFAEWRALVAGQELRTSFDEGSNAQLAASTAGAGAAQVLADATGWALDDISWAVGSGLLALSAATDFADPLAIRRVRDVADLVGRTGVRAEQLAIWSRGVPQAGAVDALKRSVRARYGEGQWAATVTPVSDNIREAKRDALVGLLVGRGDFVDVEAIYDELLVDTQMSACTLTSRIKLAIGSVQLFVQRGLIGLEAAAVDFSEAFEQHWTYEKNYRVWEARQKVYFYPENWIEPELRVNKTPFFDAFESDLDQGELSEANVERAFKNYLYRLDEVANLEIVSIYEESVDIDSDAPPTGSLDRGTQYTIVHVVGRTRTEPRKHFYRKREKDVMWTAWSPIELEIRGDNVSIVSYQRRLFLFWAELEEVPDHPVEGDYHKARFSWSESRDSGWTAPKSITPQKSLYVKNLAFLVLVSQVYGRTLYLEMQADVNAFFGYLAPDHWAFRYDSCLDTLVPVDRAPVPPERFGRPVTRGPDSQRQYAVGTKSTLHMIDSLDQYYYVLRSIYADFHITQTTQEPYYMARMPAVFDDGKHALYMAPHRRSDINEGNLPWAEFALSQEELAVGEPSGAVPPSRAADELQTEVVWGGVVPGGSVIDTQEVTPLDTAAVLQYAVVVAAGGLAIDEVAGGSSPVTALGSTGKKYRLDNFNHPYTCRMLKDLSFGGIDGVLAAKKDTRRQAKFEEYITEDLTDTSDLYILAAAGSLATQPRDEYDFRYGSAYGQYNWELFFHAPLLIAERFRRDQKFEEAARWYHYIFNPRQGQVQGEPTSAARFWNIKPLYEEAVSGPKDIISAIFTGGGANLGDADEFTFIASILQWLSDPFNPHAIADIRSGTYRWVVVRKYLDNLFDWADSLFRRDTIESINEATQIYMLAAAILGRKPEKLASIDSVEYTYSNLNMAWLFGGLVELESFGVAASAVLPNSGLAAVPPDNGPVEGVPVVPPPQPMWWYFCLPANPQLLAYWDKLSDRLFKIRNCQNIDGLTRQLALFAPPIDPALLVRARAAGLSLDSVLSELHAPVAPYRYRVLAARAMDVCNDVKALGGALLSAMEKRDSEALSQLRAQHEVALNERVREVRKTQVEDASEQLKVLEAQTDTVTARKEYYQDRNKTSARERRHEKAMRIAQGLDIGAAVAKVTGAGVKLGFGVIQPAWFAEGLIAIAETLSTGANISRTVGQTALTQAGYDRRKDDWDHQAGQAELEIAQLETQVAAADIRIAIAKRELDNIGSQIAESETTYAFMRSKYTNEQLYGWMVGQISGLYFQSYKLAYDLAKQAERAMQRELHIDDTFVAFDSWDNLKKGLLAGERLQLDIRRMEAAHLAKDKREYELTKRISLRAVDAGALVDLREGGECVFELPEVLFDLDHPGQYMRRIKSVSLSIPAVVGPHTSVGARLVLERHRVRVDPTSAAPYPETETDNDNRFEYGYGGAQAIATSSAKDDSGMFQLNFSDERYLPFEGSGVVSRWRIVLPADHRQFDYATISDVELTVAYTAREGGDTLRTTVQGAITELVNAAAADMVAAAQQPEGMTVMLHAKKDFAVDWERFLRPTGSPVTTLSVPLTVESFPHVLRTGGLTATGVEVIVVPREGTTPVGAGPQVSFAPTSVQSPTAFALDQATLHGGQSFSEAVDETSWVLDLSGLSIDEPDDVEDLILLVRFSI